MMSAIIENALYGTIFIETSPSTGTASWTNQTATFVNGSVSRGGTEDYIGLAQGIVGSGSLQFYENSNTILPGYWIRIRVAAGNVWSGFVQDVLTQTIFEGGTSKTMKILIVCDWTSYVGQFYVPDVSGTDDVVNDFTGRANSLNNFVDATNATSLVTVGTNSSATYYLGDVRNRTFSEQLDITVASIPSSAWYPTVASPTNGTTGRTGLVNLTVLGASTGITFTDGTHTGTPALLAYYNEINTNYGSSDISNSVILTNQSLREVDFRGDWTKNDSTSITSYGRRAAAFEVTTSTDTFVFNLVPNPALADSGDFLTSGTANLTLNRQLLTDVATGATNMLTLGTTQPVTDGGNFVAMGRVSALTTAIPFAYGGPEFNGTYGAFITDPSVQYTASVYMRGGVGQASMAGFAAIRWYDNVGATISTSNGTSSAISSTAWGRRTVTATAPSNAYSAVIFAWFTFSGTNNTGNRYFSTAAQMELGASATTWFSGDTTDTASNQYYWAPVGESSGGSIKITNFLETIASSFLTANKTPVRAPRQLRWNVQQNINAVDNLELYKKVDVWFQGVKWQQYITGITYTLDSSGTFTNRWMADIELRPVANI